MFTITTHTPCEPRHVRGKEAVAESLKDPRLAGVDTKTAAKVIKPEGAEPEVSESENVP
jgi:hypothetical protein